MHAASNKPTLVQPALSRRSFLFDSLGATLSVTAVALLSGCSGLARDASRSDAQATSDVQILNTALSAEREAVAAYQLGADSGLLEPTVRQVAVTFQDHHKAHAEVLAETIRKLGGEVSQAPARYAFPTDELQRQDDVLRFAAGLERGAVSAYVGAIPLFGNRDLIAYLAAGSQDPARCATVTKEAKP